MKDSRLTAFQSTVFQVDFGLYLVKCLLGASACYGLYVLFPDIQFSWSIVSVLLVLAPDFHDSVKLAVARMKANIIGAAIGLGTFLVRTPDLWSLLVSVVSTIFVCTFLQLGAATRTALAAVVIVLIQEKEHNDWNLGLQRMVAVVAGSVVALLLTLAFRNFPKKSRSDDEKDASE